MPASRDHYLAGVAFIIVAAAFIIRSGAADSIHVVTTFCEFFCLEDLMLYSRC